jgi:tripartite-type tricarboxylate transporter receptor subunit TctC
MKMKKMRLSWLAGLFLVGFFSFSQAAEFPTKDLNGIIMWGAGGPTDIAARALTPLVEKTLGKQIILQNKTGASGAVAVQWVYNQASDGYTLLYGAQDPQIYRVMDIGQLDYKDFYPINIYARGVGVIACNVNAPWKTFADLISDAKRNPGAIKMGSTGPGALAHISASMMKAIDGVTFNHIIFPGDGPVATAIMGGHVQFSTPTMLACKEHIRAGRLRALAVLSDEPVEGMEQVPLITSFNPGYKKFLPWGWFLGAWVKRDTPDDAKKKLVDAFKKGSEDPKFKDFLKNMGAVPMGISGVEADTFLTKFQNVTTWLLHDAGAAKVSPEKFGFPRP